MRLLVALGLVYIVAIGFSCWEIWSYYKLGKRHPDAYEGLAKIDQELEKKGL